MQIWTLDSEAGSAGGTLGYLVTKYISRDKPIQCDNYQLELRTCEVTFIPVTGFSFF